MHRGSPNIYEGPCIELAASLLPDLRDVAGTTGHVAIYIGNGHAGWEAANANLFSRGDKALVLATGQFGHELGQQRPAPWGSRSRCWTSASPRPSTWRGSRRRCGPTPGTGSRRC